MGMMIEDVSDGQNCRTGYHQRQILMDRTCLAFLPAPYARTDACK